MMRTQSEGVASMRSSLANDKPMPSLLAVKDEPKTLATLSEFSQMSAKVSISFSTANY